jgi:phospholipase/carboxylesterase
MDIMTAAVVPAKISAKMLMVLFHGYGADGVNLIDLGHVWGKKFPTIEFIAPNAPFLCEQGMGYQWSSLTDYSPEKNALALQQLFPALKKYLDQELNKRSLGYENLLLMGFSQGANLVLHLGCILAQHNHFCAGVIAYAGWMVPIPSFKIPVQEFPPVLLVHGTADTVVPLTGSLNAAHFLQSYGINVTLYQCKDLDHSISEEGIQQSEIFISSILANIKV